MNTSEGKEINGAEDDFFDAQEFDEKLIIDKKDNINEKTDTMDYNSDSSASDSHLYDVSDTINLTSSPQEQPPPSIISTEEEDKYIVRNKDTGEVYDIRELDKAPVDKYSFFPSNFEPQDFSQNENIPQKKSALSSLKSFKKRQPTKKEPMNPNAVHVSSCNKEEKQFSGLILRQTIAQHTGPIWAMKFSIDGCRLATGGQDSILRIWILSQENSFKQTTCETKSSSNFLNLNIALLFLETPERVFTGHTAPIIDVSWNRSNFVLTASMDKTVKLWHISREDCLHSFQHPDSVPAVDFHPKEDRCFLSGCFDNKVRIWDIPDARVVSWAQTPVMITAATFNPSGTMAVVGLLNGTCTFYQSDQLRYYTQIECRNSNGPLKRGRKVTGITFAPGGGKRLLVTTNDSRMRMFNIEDYSRCCKYKGMVNDNLQIKAHFSQDGEKVICGSENGHVYIWDTTISHSAYIPSLKLVKTNSRKIDRNASYEHFSATTGSRGIITVALFAPASTFALAMSNEKRKTTNLTKQDLSNGGCSSIIVTASYDGCIKVFENISSSTE